MNAFTPLAVGPFDLPNRLAMAPMTRTRAEADGTPNDLVAEYYRQRASLGLIVTEGIYPSTSGKCYANQPGLETDAHIVGWRVVTDAVHEAGGRIVAQLMHAGRNALPDVTGQTLVAPSAVAKPGVAWTATGTVENPVPRALAATELPGVVAEFVASARRALDAGFDAVEIHGANTYLLHQFLAPEANLRTDAYGATPAGRARLTVEVAAAVAEAVGADRTALRLSPEYGRSGIVEDDPQDVRATYGAVVDGIAPLGLAYLSLLHRDPAGALVQDLRARFGGPVLVNTGNFSRDDATTRDQALALIAGGHADGVLVGRAALANPDLVRRWREDLPVNDADRATFYGGGAEGYTDYSVHAV